MLTNCWSFCVRTPWYSRLAATITRAHKHCKLMNLSGWTTRPLEYKSVLYLLRYLSLAVKPESVELSMWAPLLSSTLTNSSQRRLDLTSRVNTRVFRQVCFTLDSLVWAFGSIPQNKSSSTHLTDMKSILKQRKGVTWWIILRVKMTTKSLKRYHDLVKKTMVTIVAKSLVNDT